MRETGQMSKRRGGISFKHYVAALLLSISVPLLAGLAWIAYTDFADSTRREETEVQRSAQLSAARTALFLHESEDILRGLSQHPELRALDRRRCGTLLSVVNDLLKYHANAVTRDASGKLICSAVAPRNGERPAAALSQYFDEVLRKGKFTIGKPVRSPFTGTWVLALGYPLRDARGAVVGVVALAVDLVKLHEIVNSVALISGAAMQMVDGDGIVVASSYNSETAVGRPAGDKNVLGKSLQAQGGIVHALDAAGVESIYGIASVADTDWHIYAGLPVAAVYAQSQSVFRRNIMIIAGIVILAALLPAVIARKIVKPVETIAGAANAVARGDRTARAAIAGPAEMKLVAMQFNRMLDILIKAEQRLSGIIASATDAIITINERHEIALINPAVEIMFGHSKSDLLGKPVSVLIPERYLPAHATHIENFATAGITGRMMGQFGEIMGRRADGGEFPLDASISQMEWDGQRLFTVIMRDVTRRIEAEKALRESEERLRLAVESGGVGLWERNIASGETIWNSQVKIMFGLSEETNGLEPAEFLSAVHPDDRGKVRLANAASLERLSTYDEAFRIVRPDGEIRWVVSKGHCVHDSSGRPQKVLGSMIDITAQKQVEEQLRVNYEFLDRIFETTHFCVVYLDPHFKYVRVNKAYADACRQVPGFFTGKNHFDLYPDEQAESIFHEVVATARPFTVYASPCELPGHPECGVTYWDWTLHPLCNTEGVVEGLLFVLLDVTARARAVQELERKTAISLLLALLARAANEAKTPEDAMRVSLRRLCIFGGWALGRLAMTHGLGGDMNLSRESVWHAADQGRYDAFIHTSEDVRKLSMTGAFIGVVLREKRPVWIADLEKSGEFTRKPLALAQGLRAAFAFPVIVHGAVVAFLEFYADAPRPIDADLVETSELIAAQLARSIERRRAEQANAQLAAIVESSNDAILMRNLERKITSWNAAAERLLGWSAEEAIGQSIDLILPPEYRGEARRRRLPERLAAGEILGPVESIHMRKDGTRVSTLLTFSPVKDDAGNIMAYSFTLRDVSELKRSQEALQRYNARLIELSQRLQEAEESERRAIARELHDRIGQDLSTLTLLLGGISAKISRESFEAVGKQLTDVQNLLKGAVENVRDVMADLRPLVLDDYGLFAALRHHVTEFTRRTGIAVELNGEDLHPRLQSVVETAIFRISQEALNNVAKHAQAKNVYVSLNVATESVMLEIMDDGVGIDIQDDGQYGRHMGMTIMRERADAAGIVLRVESAPGAGTRIVLEVARAT